jgi:hypothetical protein
MSDKEDSAATLGDSEKLCVQNPVADPVPAASQRPDNGSHIPSTVNREQIGDVLKDKPLRCEFSQQPHHFAEQTGPAAGKSFLLSRVADVLARPSPSEDSSLRGKPSCPNVITTHLRHVIKQNSVRKMVFEDRSRDGINLHSRNRFHPGTFKRARKPANTGKQLNQRQIGHSHPSRL